MPNVSSIIVYKDVLFYDLAIVVSGGLLVGTVLTLGVVPVLYSLLFRDQGAPVPRPAETAAAA